MGDEDNEEIFVDRFDSRARIKPREIFYSVLSRYVSSNHFHLVFLPNNFVSQLLIRVMINGHDHTLRT